MIKEKIQTIIKKSLIEVIKEQYWNIPQKLNIPLNIPPDKEYGDYSSSLPLVLSKLIKENPLSIARLLLAQIEKNKINIFTKVEVAPPGYLNFYLQPESLQKDLKNITPNLKNHKNAKQTIIVEYSSPNIAKPMHIGHLRSTIIGETLANLYKALGYKVIRWNYLGDWGTQFGKLIVAYKLWGNKDEVKKNPINTLLTLYQKFHQESKNNLQLESLAQQEFKKLEQGDKTNQKLWIWFKKESLKEFQFLYQLLGIKFDIVNGESDFEKDLLPLINFLKKKKLTQKSEGALIISLDSFQLPPALLQKSDEASLYLTRDLASLIFRIKKYRPQKILYVVGNEQDLYFKQLFTLAQILHLNPKTELIHVKFGLVLNSNKKKFSTRTGELISLKDVIDQAFQTAFQIVSQKHSSWPKQKQNILAQKLALGALKFNNLKSLRTADVVFDWEQMLNFKGGSSVYLQYTYARLNKILLRANKIGPSDSSLLNHSLELELIKILLNFPEAVQKSAEEYAPHLLVNYLLSLADLANNYYEQVPILKENIKKRKNAQLLLLKKIILIFQQGLSILGIESLKEI
ncbi:MAG: arginine--tRNA ligase [Minisyncoccia bacterium]